MKQGGSHEQVAYLEAKKKYLAAGKNYSGLLTRMMGLDPNVLKIAEEIMTTGDGLSVHDNRFLTAFYNELKSKSKIDKKYYDLLLEIKKAKTELDNAVATLSRQRISFLLRKAGIPPRRTNHNKDIIATQINSPSVGLLEKISLPEVLDVKASEDLDSLLASGELICESGALVPKTKVARDFVRNLEKKIRENVNNDYLIGHEPNLLQNWSKLADTNLLDFIRTSADKEHAREIERKIDSGDVALAGGNLIAVTDKGKRYLALLIEELSLRLEKKIKEEMLEKNQVHVQGDVRLKRVSEALADFDIKLGQHQRLASFAGSDNTYPELIARVSMNKKRVESLFAELMTLQETISSSFTDVKKQLLLLVTKEQLDVSRLLSLLVAVRYLSVYEDKYEAKLTELEGALGVSHENFSSNFGPESIAKLSERYSVGELPAGAGVDSRVRDIIISSLKGRRELGDVANEALVRSLLVSPQIKDFKKLVATGLVAKKHIVDTLSSTDCLYSGFGNITELLTELAELEIEKNEKLVDLTHELELAHKELWLARIANNNSSYISTNFGELPEETKAKATVASKEAIARIRKEVRELLARYREGHKKHSDEFARTLRKSLQELSGKGDISKISADLVAKYRKMSKDHDVLLTEMENDIMSLEKRLLDFEESAPAVLEKLLISDIRANI